MDLFISSVRRFQQSRRLLFINCCRNKCPASFVKLLLFWAKETECATLKLVCCQPSIAWFRWIILYDVWWTLYIQLSIKWCAGWKRKIGPNNLKLGTEWTYSSSLDKYSMIKRIGKLLLIDGFCLFTWNRVENLSKLRLCVPLPSYFCLCIKSDLNFLFCFSCYVALDVYKLGRIQSKKTEEMIIDSGNTKISIYITPAYMVTHHHP